MSEPKHDAASWHRVPSRWQILCALITSIPSPRSATRAREVMFGRGQRGGKFRLPLPEELAHDGPIIPGALGLRVTLRSVGSAAARQARLLR